MARDVDGVYKPVPGTISETLSATAADAHGQIGRGERSDRLSVFQESGVATIGVK